MKRRLLLLSNSTLYGGGYLEHCQQQIKDFFGQYVKRILFIPYAMRHKDAYAKIARAKFRSLGYDLDSIHEASGPVKAVREAQGIFIGGGNTFHLYDKKVLFEIKRRVLEDGVPYMGSNAGTNVSTISIHTTNDMPIVYLPSFNAIGLLPFNINPHFLDSVRESTSMKLEMERLRSVPSNCGYEETRKKRIIQYLEEPQTPPVLALREGSMLLVEGNKATLLGTCKATLFSRFKSTKEFETVSDLSFLLTDGQ